MAIETPFTAGNPTQRCGVVKHTKGVIACVGEGITKLTVSWRFVAILAASHTVLVAFDV